VASPPTGTVTFLFTDIEGSTRMWERNPQAMQAALARHDELLRRAIEERGGYVFKTVGDAFCCAFPTAPGALEAALDAQRLLLKERLGESETLSGCQECQPSAGGTSHAIQVAHLSWIEVI
jgi:class 3 adenylate cyclase